MLILSYDGAIPSCRLLRDEILKLCGKKLLITTDEDKEHVISYGNSYSNCQFNPRSFIRTCSNKKTFSDLLLENGFYTPEFLNRGLPKSYPCLIRTTLTSYGGEGIIVIKDQEEFDDNFKHGYYYTDFIRTSSEYRVHVLGKEIKRVFKKVRDEDKEEEEFPIRNNSRGYHFSLRNDMSEFKEMQVQIGELINFLSDKFNAKFYALDVGWDNIGKKYFTFEANTAPGLNDNTANVYAEYLVKELGLK